MKTKLHVFVLLLLALNAFSQTQVGSTIVLADANADFGAVAAVNNNGDFFITSAPFTFSSNDPGLVRVFNLQNNNWVQVGTDLMGGGNGDTFGAFVAMNEVGNRVAVGATQRRSGGPGYVRVFEFSSGQYVQIGGDIVGEANGDSFGGDVAINGDGTKIIVGAIFNDANFGNQFASIGHIRMYSFDGTSWSQMGAEIDGGNPNDNFGDSVDISKDGTRIVASASGFDGGGTNKGLVRVYEFSNGSWSQLGADLVGTNDNDRFGNVSMSDDGNRIALRTQGKVKVYEFNGTNWLQVGADITGMSTDVGAANLDGSGNLITVASRSADNNKGYVQLYRFQGGSWTQIGNTVFGDNDGDNVGSHIEVKNGYVIAGSSDFNGGTDNNGGVRVYNFNTPLSSDNQVLKNNISVYPNPVSSFINIAGIDLHSVTIYNINGKEILNTSSSQISLKGFAKGMYLLKIEDVSHRNSYKKIILK